MYISIYIYINLMIYIHTIYIHTIYIYTSYICTPYIYIHMYTFLSIYILYIYVYIICIFVSSSPVYISPWLGCPSLLGINCEHQLSVGVHMGLLSCDPSRSRLQITHVFPWENPRKKHGEHGKSNMCFKDIFGRFLIFQLKYP